MDRELQDCTASRLVLDASMAERTSPPLCNRLMANVCKIGSASEPLQVRRGTRKLASCKDEPSGGRFVDGGSGGNGARLDPWLR